MPFVHLLSIVAVVALGVIAASAIDDRVDRALTRLALYLFRDVIERWGRKKGERRQLLKAIHSPQMYATYAAKSILFALLIGFATAVAGLYAGYAIFTYLSARGEAIGSSLPERFRLGFESDAVLDPVGGSGEPIRVPVDVIARVLPPSVVSTLAWLASLIPAPLRSWARAQLTSSPSGGGAAGGSVEIVIEFPQIGPVLGRMTMLSPSQLLVTVVLAVTIGTAVAVTAYWFQWYTVRRRAKQRAARIDESLVRTLSFVYALSRSGMLFPDIMRIVGRNREVFGESAEEIAVVVKEMDLFGANLVPAIQRTAEWTPSDEFGELLHTFANVLRSGQNVSSFLRNQYEQRQEERMADQEQMLELFTALGEAYVAVLVAGPLFLLTILTIFGTLAGGVLLVIQLFVYLVIPLMNAQFLWYVDGFAEPGGTTRMPTREVDDSQPPVVRRVDETVGSRTVADGGTGTVTVEENLRRLALHDRFQSVRWALEHPVETLTSKPETLLYVTAPIAVASIALRGWLGAGSGLSVARVDDWLIQATLFVVGTYAVVETIHTRRLRSIEAMIPDFLDSLANTNEAGMTFTKGLQRIETGDMEPLNKEFERLLSDIEWGGGTEAALRRFAERIGSPTLTRTIALITNSLEASGNIGPVIRIAATEARKVKRLKRKRRQEMFLYVVIVYLSFLVFLGIAIMLKVVLVPTIPSASQVGGATGAGRFGVSAMLSPASEASKATYMLTLFHAAVVQAIVSGFVAGKLGEESAKSGAKHVTIMLGTAYALFVLLG